MPTIKIRPSINEYVIFLTKGRLIGQSIRIRWNDFPANAKGISHVSPTNTPKKYNLNNSAVIF